MSQYLIYDQADLFRSAKSITPSIDDNSDYELVIIEDKPKSADSIRKAYHRMNLDPLDKAMEKGAEYVRAYYNGFNLRKRKK